MDKRKQDQLGQAPIGKDFVPTEMGSARYISLDGEGSTYKYESGPTENKQGFHGPPWSVEPSMHFLCDEVGVDYSRFIDALAVDRNDMEMAQEFGVSDATIKGLREHFYRVESIAGNYGQD